MIVGLDKMSQGKPIIDFDFGFPISKYTGYFQLDHGKYYWQVMNSKGTKWLQFDRTPYNINYSNQINPDYRGTI